MGAGARSGATGLRGRVACRTAACAGVRGDGRGGRVRWIGYGGQQAGGGTDCGAGTFAGAGGVTTGSSPEVSSALRLCRCRRRAERWEVDAAEPDDRGEAVHRHAEGADDAVPRAGHPDARRRARCCWSIRRASSRRGAGWIARWWRRPGAACAMPM